MFFTIWLIIVFIAIVDYIHKKRMDMRTNIPGAKPIPIFGNVLQNLGHTPESLLAKTKTHVELYGGMFRFYVFNSMGCFTSDPKDIELILNNTKHISKNELYDALHPWLKTGLLLSTGAKWHARRKIITPAFHFSILENFIRVFDEQSSILVQQLGKHCNNEEPFDIHSFIALATLDAVSESALGIKVNAQTDPEHSYVKSISGISEVVTEIFLNVIYHSPLILSTLGYKLKRRQTKLLKTLHSFTQNIIAERRKILETQFKENDDENEDIGKKKRMAFLDVLLQANINGKPLSDEDIREEVDTFTFEGHDTTTSGICFTLYLLSRHPCAQMKVFDEICQVIGDDHNIPVTYKHLQDLKYTENVIKESLRMYPPVAVIGRIIEEDLVIGDKLLPAGTSVSIGLIMTLNDQRLFPEPEKFIPERHNMEKSVDSINPFAYIPFSAGPRNCIGQKFAMLEMKSLITKVLRHYELLPLGDGVKPYVNIVLRSRTGFQMGIRRRS